jgi:putative inorganic carbon (hco3(-)) transporter
MDLTKWCTRIITWGFYLLFILVPIILTPWNYELFEYNKMILTYALTVIIISAWVVKMMQDKEIRIAKTPLDIPIALFVVSQLVSTIFSMDPHVSWNGYYSRFNGGMWSVISYVLLYYAFVSNFVSPSNQSSQSLESGIVNSESGKKNKKKILETKPSPNSVFSIHNSVIILLKIALSTATIVSLYGVAERLGIDKHLWVQDVQNRVFSSMGQPNWLAAYLVALLPVSMAFALKHQIINSKKQLLGSIGFVFWNLLSVLFFLVLLFTRSRSGLVGFAIADCIFWLILTLKTQNKQALILPVGIIHAVFALIIFFNGSGINQIDQYLTLEGIKTMANKKVATQSVIPQAEKPTGPALETGGTESGTIRKYVWQGAITAWQSTTKTFLIGTGTETFAFAFYQYRPVGHNLTSEWDFLYNKAHNEYLNYLATTGIFGLVSYMLLIGVCMVWFIKSQWHSSPDAVALALFAGWLSILITNFFGFSVVVIQLFFFLFPAMLFVINGNSLDAKLRKTISLKHPNLVAMGITTGMCILLTIIALHWQADTLYATSYRLSRVGQYARALPLMNSALRLNPGEPMYHDEIATTLAALAMASAEQKDATAASALAKQSLTESDIAITTSPKNVNFWKTRTKIYYSLASYDPTMNEAAIGALEKARELSPNDPKIYYNLAILNGRVDKSQEAIPLLLKAKELKADYHDAYYALYVFYTDMKKPDLARAVLEEYIQTIDPADIQFTEILGKIK